MRLALIFSSAMLVAGSAQAMDCSKAKAPGEKAICADPAANTADDAMSAAFAKLRSSLAPDQAKALLENQRQWLRNRNFGCEEKKGAVLGSCLREATQARIAALEMRPEAGSYPENTFVPVMIDKNAKRNGEYDITIDLRKFRSAQTPAEQAFNAAVDAILKDAPLHEDRDSSATHKLGYQATMRVTFAAPTLISAEAEVYMDGGGAHPNTSVSHINIDGRSGKALTSGEVFAAEGRKAALKLCAAQIRQQKEEKGAVDQSDETAKADTADASLSEAFDNIENWRFATGKTDVVFNPYQLGSYAEGAYSCAFDNSELKPLVKPSFPLPE